MEEIANPFRGEPAAQRYARGRLDVHAEFARRIVWATGGKPLRAALDLGCGTGLSTTALASAAERVVGLDPSAPMIAEAAARCTARWVRGRGEELPFPESVFDLVAMGCTFHWCEPKTVLAETHRVLAAGGHLAVYDHYLGGRMEGEPRFAAWLQGYHERFPNPPRHPVFDPAMAEAFVPVASERFEHVLPHTPAALVLYLTSQSRVLSAVERGCASLHDVETELHASVRSFFAGRSSARFAYRGVLDVLRKN